MSKIFCHKIIAIDYLEVGMKSRSRQIWNKSMVEVKIFAASIGCRRNCFLCFTFLCQSFNGSVSTFRWISDIHTSWRGSMHIYKAFNRIKERNCKKLNATFQLLTIIHRIFAMMRPQTSFQIINLSNWERIIFFHLIRIHVSGTICKFF